MVSLNCFVNPRAAAEVARYEPDIVLLQESPSREHLEHFWSPGFWMDHRDNRVKHRRQIEDVLVNVRSVPVSRSMIIGGDFNAPPNDAALVPLREHLFDTFRQAGRGWAHTGTNRFPLFRVDRIWASADRRAISAAAGHRAAGSRCRRDLSSRMI